MLTQSLGFLSRIVGDLAVETSRLQRLQNPSFRIRTDGELAIQFLTCFVMVGAQVSSIEQFLEAFDSTVREVEHGSTLGIKHARGCLKGYLFDLGYARLLAACSSTTSCYWRLRIALERQRIRHVHLKSASKQSGMVDWQKRDLF